MKALTARYVGNPLSLVALLASLSLAGYAVEHLVSSRPVAVAVWFVAAAVLHDVVVLPLYAVADAAAVRASRFGGRPSSGRWLNYLRFPLAISLLLLLVFSPEIFRLSDIYAPTTGLSSKHFFEHWLLITAVLFGVSAVLLALSYRRRRV